MICIDSFDQEDSAVVLKNAHNVHASRESEQLRQVRPAKKQKLRSKQTIWQTIVLNMRVFYY